MPVTHFAGLLLIVIAAAGTTVALTHYAGLLGGAALIPFALAAAALVRWQK